MTRVEAAISPLILIKLNFSLTQADELPSRSSRQKWVFFLTASRWRSFQELGLVVGQFLVSKWGTSQRAHLRSSDGKPPAAGR